jgi:hypothetical protein
MTGLLFFDLHLMCYIKYELNVDIPSKQGVKTAAPVFRLTTTVVLKK